MLAGDETEAQRQRFTSLRFRGWGLLPRFRLTCWSFGRSCFPLDRVESGRSRW